MLTFTRLADRLSVLGYARLGSKFYDFTTAVLGSTLSIRSFVRLGDALSAADTSKKNTIRGHLDVDGDVCLGSTLTVGTYIYATASRCRRSRTSAHRCPSVAGASSPTVCP